MSKTKTFSERLQLADENVHNIKGLLGFGAETWIPSDDYRKAKDLAELLKLKVLIAMPNGELRDKFQANWFLDDMDEKDYM